MGGGIYTASMFGGESFEDLDTGKKYSGKAAQKAWADKIGGAPVDGITGEKGYYGEWNPNGKESGKGK